MFTRNDLSAVLSALFQTRTVKSDILKGTKYWDWDLTENWVVSYIGNDDDLEGIIIIECVPEEYITGR